MPDRLGWIDAPRAALALWDSWARFAAAARADGLDRVVLCGMGGSSLAPHVLATSFGARACTVLDSTDPGAVLDCERANDPARTLYVVSSKSGATVETLSCYRYFAARVPAAHFAAITDPGTPLERLAAERGFRACFPHPTDVGGRYAALTVVGMLPAALLEVDGRALLERAAAVSVPAARALGERVATAVRAGRDKLALQLPARVATLGLWIEQLVAESSGKGGKGVVPVPGTARGPDVELMAQFSADPLDLGAEFLRWEHATYALCEQLGVNPFDQPDVEAAKAFARAELERGPADATAQPVTLAPAALARAARPGDYVGILAYLPPRPEVERRLEAVRAAWESSTGCVATLGFGPRYLHSTGQLHKGGPATGLFLVITADPAEDAEIPELGITFGRLERAQAAGDVRALLTRGRRVAHVHLPSLDELERAAVAYNPP
jgi:transaldolase/glucose-6-phosphate isomerase